MHNDPMNETAWLRSLVQLLVVHNPSAAQNILANMEKIMADLTALTAAVTKVTEQSDAIVTLVEGLAEQLRQAATDPIAIQALADQLDREAADMAAAVAANTNPAPQPGSPPIPA